MSVFAATCEINLDSLSDADLFGLLHMCEVLIMKRGAAMKPPIDILAVTPEEVQIAVGGQKLLAIKTYRSRVYEKLGTWTPLKDALKAIEDAVNEHYLAVG